MQQTLFELALDSSIGFCLNLYPPSRLHSGYEQTRKTGGFNNFSTSALNSASPAVDPDALPGPFTRGLSGVCWKFAFSLNLAMTSFFSAGKTSA
jgi:hypothetical protein